MPSSNFMNNMSQGIIYKFTAPDGAVYIGQTAHLRKRLEQWFSPSGYKNGLIGKHRALYAPELWNYEVLELIDYGSEPERLNTRETFWIGYYTALSQRDSFKMLNGNSGGAYKNRNAEKQLIEGYVHNRMIGSQCRKGTIDFQFGLVDRFDENGELKQTAYVSQLKTSSKTIKSIMDSCTSHCWLGFSTYRKHGECKEVEPCPNRPIKKEKEKVFKYPVYFIYDVRKRIVVGKACTIREATKYMGPNTTAISTVLKGGKEQYNGFIIKCGSIPPTNEEYNAALIKSEMPR